MILTNKKQEDISGIILRRRNQALDKKEFSSLVRRVLTLLIAGWILFTQVFLITQINGNEMYPAIKDGDLVFAYRIQDKYSKNDVVVYNVSGENHVGRIIAIETDVIMMDETGSLLVNGTTQSGEIMYPTYAKDRVSYPHKVPDNCIFVLGDYRTQTKDSRDYGPIYMDNVLGKVITIVRRRGL